MKYVGNCGGLCIFTAELYNKVEVCNLLAM